MDKKRALLSVSDKSGIETFATGLVERGWEILSTGGTARRLREAGLPVTDVSEVTGHPEMMDGRVKTLHPAIHAGLLARAGRGDDLEAMRVQGYETIDLVAVNLYPFEETVAAGVGSVAEAMEKVDIGGPTMIRAAAKNHDRVWVVVDPNDYGAVLDAMEGSDEEARIVRRGLAAKVFARMNAYDGAIAEFLSNDVGQSPSVGPPEGALALRTASGTSLRYGENPDQAASFYPLRTGGGIGGLEQLHGKALSYNNILDLDGALLALAPFARSELPAVCIVKHTTPCGIAVGTSLEEAYEKALRTDSTSAFGSIVAVNRRVDEEAAEALSGLFVECLVAPGFEPGALEKLREKKNVRLMQIVEPDGGTDSAVAAFRGFLEGITPQSDTLSIRSVYGGVLAQSSALPPYYGEGGIGWEVVTERTPSPQELDDLDFAWSTVFSVKSNAIVLARDGATIGIGAGQMSRVDSSKIAVRKAGDAGLDIPGAVLASDAFFPFRDGVDAAAEAGVRAIVQPGGSRRDTEVVAAADEHGIAMVFTGRRLFRH